jgi:site-specific recombinase XerD
MAYLKKFKGRKNYYIAEKLGFKTSKTGKRYQPERHWSTGTDNEKDANDILKKYHSNQIRMQNGLPPRHVPWEEFKKKFFDSGIGVVADSTRIKQEKAFQWIEECLQPSSLKDVTSDGIDQVKKARVEAGVSRNTLRTDLFNVRRIFEYAFDQKLIPENPCNGIQMPKRQKTFPRHLSKDEVRSLLRAAEALPDRANQIHLYAIEDIILMVQYFYYTGARLSEAIPQRIEWIDMEYGFIKLRAKKTLEERQVAMCTEFQDAIRAFLAKTKRRGGLLFPNSNTGKELRENTIQKAFCRLFGKAGLDGLSLHSLRHSFTTHVLGGGANARTAQELVGHKSLNTTQGYAHVRNKEMVMAVENLNLKKKNGATQD